MECCQKENCCGVSGVVGEENFARHGATPFVQSERKEEMRTTTPASKLEETLVTSEHQT
jgi:hypothetical protein